MNKQTKSLMIRSGLIILIFGFFLILSAFFVAGFDISKFHKLKDLEKKEEAFSVADLNKLEFNTFTGDFYFEKNNSDKIIIQYYEHKYQQYEINVEENALFMISKKIDRPILSYVMNTSFFNEDKITVSLPESFQGDLAVESKTGYIRSYARLTLNQVTLNNATGSIKFENLKANELNVTATTGSLRLTNIEARKITAKTTTGSLNLKNLKADEINASATTGSVRLNNTKAPKLYAHSTTGTIRLTNLEAQMIEATSSTGSIKGNIIGKKADYSIIAGSKSGSCNLPTIQAAAGIYSLQVQSNSGSIKIYFSN